MPEHDPAQPRRAAGHACTCGAHQITRDCPVGCLAAILSARAFNPLARAQPAGPGATVGDVADLHLHDRLGGINGLGPRRIGEIEVSLVFAGLIGADGRGPAAPSAADRAETVPDAFGDHMKLAEVAAAFRVHPKTIIRWADAGKLPSFRTAGGHRRFRAADVRGLLAAARHPAGPSPVRLARAASLARRRSSQ
jgi:excisionase family DNA binding protein